MLTLAGGRAGFFDGVGAEARFNSPNGLALGADGTLYVADSGNHAIRKVTPLGEVTTIAGGLEGFEDGPAGSAKFKSPYGLAIAADGTIYVADTFNHRIRKISKEGDVTTIAGSGEAGFEDAVATAARFNTPFSVDTDASGTVCVADTGNHRIRKIAPDGTVSTVAGGASGYKNGTLEEARFAVPNDVAFGTAGKLAVADYSNHCIRLIDLAAGTVSTLAGNGTEGLSEGTGPLARFRSVTGLAISLDGSILVADNQNHRVRKVTVGGVVTTLSGSDAGLENGPLSKARFNEPTDVAIGRDGTIYVADTNNHRIRKIQR